MKHKMRKLRRKAQNAWERQEIERERSLGDFTTTYRVIPLSLAAVAIGVVTAYIAWALLRLIGLVTNLFYFGRWSASFVSPAQNHRARGQCWCRWADRSSSDSWPAMDRNAFAAMEFRKQSNPS